MHWRFLSDSKWLFLPDPEWRFSPDANTMSNVLCFLMAGYSGLYLLLFCYWLRFRDK